LRSDLDHAIVLARGLHHLATLITIVARGLFDIDILTGLASPDCGEGVPVVRSRNGNGGGIFLLEQSAHVAVVFGIVPLFLLDARGGTLACFLIHIADGCNSALGVERGIEPDVIGAAATETDDPKLDLVVRAENRERAGSNCGAGLNEAPS